VRAAFDDAAAVHHDDLVGVDDGRQAVRDDESGSIARQTVEFLLMACSESESSADVASSKIRIGGFLRMARAIAMRCFSPPDSFTPRSPTGVSYFAAGLDQLVQVGGAAAATTRRGRLPMRP
jgi:hypothetical protein